MERSDACPEGVRPPAASVRKQLSELAIHEPRAFAQLVDLAKQA